MLNKDQYNQLKIKVDNIWTNHISDKDTNDSSYFPWFRKYEAYCVELLDYEIENDLLTF